MINIKGFTIVTDYFSETVKNSFEEVVDICLKSGFIGIEGDSSVFEKKSDKELEKIGKLFTTASLIIETFHLPWSDLNNHDIANLYEADRKKVTDLMKKSIDQAVILGSSIGILHASTKKFFLYFAEEEGIDRIMLQIGKSLEAMLKHCEQYKFKIAIENMLPFHMFGGKTEHLEEIIKRFDHPLLGFCLDTGHALVTHAEKAMEVFHFMKNKLIAFHLADNAGDRDSHLAPGHGNFFWKKFFTELKKLDYHGTMCIEAPPFSYGPNYSIESWQTMRKELKTLSGF